MDSERLEAWVLYMDLYGFSEQVRRDEEGTFERLTGVSMGIREKALRLNFSPYILSDSIFIIAPFSKTRARFHEFLRFIRDIQDDLVEERFLPRGGISVGTVYTSNRVVVGLPIIRAVQTEASIAIPCVFLPHREHKTGAINAKWRHHMPTKSAGLVLGYILSPKTLSRYRALILERLEDAMINGPDTVAAGLKALDLWISSGGKRHGTERH